MDNHELVTDLVNRSRAAQLAFADATQEQADAATRAICKVINDNAESLARMAVEETGMGVYEHKIAKNRGKATLIWNDLKTKKSVGALRYIPEKEMLEVAKPVGIVCCIAPCTNPIVTPLSNTAFALKCRNSIIIAPHPRSKKCTKVVVDLFRAELKKLGFPEDLVLMIEEPSIELSAQLMSAVDVVIATGGMGMVRSAYSSGKPALGVGAGNDQCIVDTDVDLDNVAEMVIQGRCFDNGMPCTSEQNVIVHVDQKERMLAALEKGGAYIVRKDEQVEALRRVLFPDGGPINRHVVGQDIAKIAKMAEIEIPEGTKILVAEAKGCGKQDLLCREKMCPVLAVLTYSTFEEGVDIALQNLLVEGRGHCAVIHSNNRARVEYAAGILPVSRLLINQCGASGGGGAWINGMTPTTTLGCGSWGNNSVSENITYTHLMNVTHVAFRIENVRIPSIEEIFS